MSPIFFIKPQICLLPLRVEPCSPPLSLKSIPAL